MREIHEADNRLEDQSVVEDGLCSNLCQYRRNDAGIEDRGPGDSLFYCNDTSEGHGVMISEGLI